MGEYRQDGTSQIKNQHFSAMTASNTGSAQKYTVQSGDSLRILANLFYGNSDYWYVIADANGIIEGPDESLDAGTTLEVPQKSSSGNAFDEFKPQNIGDMIGDTTPAMPYVAPPPPSQAGCNAVASIVMVVIAVVVTVYTAGAAATVFAGGAVGGAGAATVGATALAGGFVGSVASQLAGKAMGVVDHFSLKSALAGGLTSAASAGMGSVLQASGSTFYNASEVANQMGKFTELGKGILAGTGVISSVAANKLVGNPASFSWKNVATSAVSAYAGAHMGIDKIGFGAGSEIPNGIVSGTLQGIASAGINYGVGKGLFNQGSWNFKDVATDAFGNALGNSIVAGMKSTNLADKA